MISDNIDIIEISNIDNAETYYNKYANLFNNNLKYFTKDEINDISHFSDNRFKLVVENDAYIRYNKYASKNIAEYEKIEKYNLEFLFISFAPIGDKYYHVVLSWRNGSSMAYNNILVVLDCSYYNFVQSLFIVCDNFLTILDMVFGYDE